jgi:hypothetical protein
MIDGMIFEGFASVGLVIWYELGNWLAIAMKDCCMGLWLS